MRNRQQQRSRWSPARLFAVGVLFLGGCFAMERPAVPPVAPPPVADQVVAPPQLERWIRVRKAERALTLYDGDQVVATYPIVLGKNPRAAKLYEGDRRTPEGEYHIVDKYFHPFWERFMLIDYPTPFNKEIYAWSRQKGLLPARGRKVPGLGGAVGIHGTEDERLNRRGVDWTHGCISLLNHDVAELYDRVPVGTRVVIEP